jgi:ribosomal protein S2
MKFFKYSGDLKFESPKINKVFDDFFYTSESSNSGILGKQHLSLNQKYIQSIFLKTGATIGGKIVHPNMRNYMDPNSGKGCLPNFWDVQKQVHCLQRMVNYVYSVGYNGLSKDVILFHSKSYETDRFCEYIAKSTNNPYMIGRWVNGLFTNNKSVGPYIRSFRTKLNQRPLSISRRRTLINRFYDRFGGLAEHYLKLQGTDDNFLPSLLVVFDIEECKEAIREARLESVPTIGLVDSHLDPTMVSHPIPASAGSYEFKLLYGTLILFALYRGYNDAFSAVFGDDIDSELLSDERL